MSAYKPDFLRLDDADHQKLYPQKGEQVERQNATLTSLTPSRPSAR